MGNIGHTVSDGRESEGKDMDQEETAGQQRQRLGSAALEAMPRGITVAAQARRQRQATAVFIRSHSKRMVEVI